MKSKKPKEYRINRFITLRLEEDKTVIYINEKKFRICKHLILNIPIRDLKNVNQLRSIDEAAKYLKNPHSYSKNMRIKISPETEFWGHCSNLEVWVESGYDTRLIHKSLAFPLLKILAKVGDPTARKRFKEEIALRIENGIESVILYLLEGKYFEIFTEEELETIYSINKNPAFWRALGYYFQYKKDYEKAIKYLGKSLMIEPEKESVWFRLGNILKKTGRTDLAIKLVMKAIKIQPKNIKYWFFLTELHFKKKDIHTTLSLIKHCKYLIHKSLFSISMEELYDLTSKFKTIVWEVKHYISKEKDKDQFRLVALPTLE